MNTNFCDFDNNTTFASDEGALVCFPNAKSDVFTTTAVSCSVFQHVRPPPPNAIEGPGSKPRRPLLEPPPSSERETVSRIMADEENGANQNTFNILTNVWSLIETHSRAVRDTHVSKCI